LLFVKSRGRVTIPVGPILLLVQVQAVTGAHWYGT